MNLTFIIVFSSFCTLFGAAAGHVQQVGPFGQLCQIWCHWCLVKAFAHHSKQRSYGLTTFAPQIPPDSTRIRSTFSNGTGLRKTPAQQSLWALPVAHACSLASWHRHCEKTPTAAEIQRLLNMVLILTWQLLIIFFRPSWITKLGSANARASDPVRFLASFTWTKLRIPGTCFLAVSMMPLAGFIPLELFSVDKAIGKYSYTLYTCNPG